MECGYQRKTIQHSPVTHIGYEEDCDERCKVYLRCDLTKDYCRGCNLENDFKRLESALKSRDPILNLSVYVQVLKRDIDEKL